MKQKKCKKILLIILFIGLITFINCNVFAAINTEYARTTTTGVNNNDLTNSIDSSGLFKAIAKLVYAVGSWLESILGTIFSLLTGTQDFPWADKIVFNAVPLLDVNFINPDVDSFFGKTDDIRGLIQNLYSTILAMAVMFFGVTVMITAVKLVLSAVASEKAKYKKAIVDWLTGFVLVFCIHFFMSFVFYLNEQLVVFASKISKASLDIATADMRKSL